MNTGASARRAASGMLKRGGLLLGLVALLVGAVVLLEERFIYFPSRALDATPAALGLPYEDVYLTTDDDVRLHGWWLPGPGPHTWLWLHGNAGNISHRLDNIARVRQRLGASVLIVDFRGYGRGEGRPSEQGTYRDAAAALAWLHARPEVEPGAVVVFGRSLGAAVALDLALRAPVRGLILENAFTSIRAMASTHYPWLPVGPLLRTRYDSLARIGQLSVPVLVLHSRDDPVVPFAHGRALYDAAPAPKWFHAIAGAGHYDAHLYGGEPYWQAIEEFLHALPRAAPASMPAEAP